MVAVTTVLQEPHQFLVQLFSSKSFPNTPSNYPTYQKNTKPGPNLNVLPI